MFDWNDEELANIIWGDATESDDHIVPFPEASEDLCNKEEWNQEAAGVTLAEQKKPEAKIDFQGKKIGSSSNIDNREGLSPSGYGKSSWPDLSSSSPAKTDQGALETEVSKSLSEISKKSSSKEEAAQPDKDVEFFQNEHQGKEQGDLIDYGWANIGSFDDLDRIFSNDDPIFSHVSIDNGVELWSSKDDSKSPAPISLGTKPASGLRNRFEPSEIKSESVQYGDQSYNLYYDKITGPASQDTQNAPEYAVDSGYAGTRSKLTVKEQLVSHETGGTIISVASGLASENVGVNEFTDKDFEQKNLLKAQQKSQGEQREKVLQNYGSWSPSRSSLTRFENQLAPSAAQSSPSPILGQQKQLQGAETFYQNIMNTYAASPVNENLANTYPAKPLLSQVQSEDLRHQPLLSGYKVSPDIVNPADSVKPLTMTPQEKIEKLRRRQQLQAMLAIQKQQQQQLSHQVLSSNESNAQKRPLEMQSHSFDGTDPRIEDLISLPAPEYPQEQDDSNTISVPVDDYFDEDAILYRLQDIISKLDIKIRLCIRDSLFRLAQSAMQRHYANDTSSTNKGSKEELEVVAREETNFSNRSTKISIAETETNPIDRTVAHLLFHRPLELRGNHPDKSKSPRSANMQCESKATNLANLPLGCLLDGDLKSNQPFSLQGLKNSFSLQGLKNSSSMFEAPPMNQLKNSPRVDTSENASTNEPADVGVQELEASL